MVTGAVGVAAYEALRKMVVKAPLRAATVSGQRGVGCSEPDSTAAASRST